ncbi:MAG: hypothetical protein J6C29_05045, partial [Clostridia bacterium]|nr:hypothetical protein [Clostridia bacterium]
MKRIKLIILLLSCIIFIYSGVQLSLSFGKEPGVIYDGKEKSFTFINTQETDLFKEFKDVIPGDVLTQEIKLYCQNISSTTNLFLKASIDDSVDLPDDITLTVYSGENIISHGSANTVNGIDDYVLLGTFSKDGTTELSVVLTVPTSIGNEISYVEKNIDWQFAVQVLEEDKKPIDSPSTGDNSNIELWIALLFISGGTVITL